MNYQEKYVEIRDLSEENKILDLKDQKLQIKE